MKTHYLTILLSLVLLGIVVSTFSQDRNFTFYSSHIPYKNEEQAMTFSKDSSSFVLRINRSREKSERVKGLSKFSNAFLINQKWKRAKVFIHFPASEIDYQVIINDSVQRFFKPLNGVANELDITHHYTGDSLLVTLVTSQINSPFSGAFLYTIDDVHLSEINPNGYFINGQPWLFITIKKQNLTSQPLKKYKYKISLYDDHDTNLISKEGGLIDRNRGVYLDSLLPYENQYYSFGCRVLGVKGWTDETPNLYRLTIQVKNEKESIIEVFSMYVGFINVVVMKDKLLVNKKLIKLRGVGYDLSQLPFTTSFHDLKDEIVRLKNSNINALLLKAGFSSLDFLDLCDKYGIYVIMELSYNTIKKDEYLRNIYAILQNHPCIIGWHSSFSENLYNQLDKINRDFNFWKAIRVVGDWKEKSIKSNTQELWFYDFVKDTLVMKENLNNSLSSSIILRSHQLPDDLNLKYNFIAKSINNNLGGLTGGILLDIKYREPVPKSLASFYYPLTIEDDGNKNFNYFITSHNSYLNLEAISFHYILSMSESIIDQGELSCKIEGDGHLGLIKIPIKMDNLLEGAYKLQITATRLRTVPNGEFSVVGKSEIDFNK